MKHSCLKETQRKIKSPLPLFHKRFCLSFGKGRLGGFSDEKMSLLSAQELRALSAWQAAGGPFCNYMTIQNGPGARYASQAAAGAISLT